MNLLDKILRLKKQFHNTEEIILRDFLALERTRLANERTLLSYLRTSVYMGVASVGFLQMNQFEEVRWLGYATAAVGMGFILVGIVRFFLLRRSIGAYYSGPGSSLNTSMGKIEESKSQPAP